ncbi:uncharacterized protein Aud_002296 [Aspergillus udagawae]|uniref:Glycosyl hydrolase family 32 C-terminal domain-containing protein n=1 Tax=Aspergillus udagawae TaxID=91492 RepID=A0A8E0R2N1_9EURO|nr:uncharacterized protein Aud_002296 [Aspergillus udagawae]GIC94965.1 hypothetical protein Aud_002296 [Aspergillus udagawae]
MVVRTPKVAINQPGVIAAPLLVDRDPTSNPGGPTIGSGTQYFVGSFDGTTFTVDANNVSAAVDVPPDSSTIDGDFVGITPVTGEDADSNVLDTYFSGDTNTGTVTSESFVINEAFINFRIAGGYHPYNPSTYGTANDTETSLNLKVEGEVVRSATGQNSAALLWQGWDVRNFINRTAVLGIADFNTGTEGWGHIIVGEIVLSESLAQDRKANWIDLGPDFYAAATYNGLPEYERVAVGWANNWVYGADIPTNPWRSSMSVMRKYFLATIDSKVTLVQEPYSLAPIEKSPVMSAGSYTAQGDSIRRLVRSNEDGSKATVIGYDAATQQLFVDRTNLGDVSFNTVFPGIYYAALTPDTRGKVTLRVLVDWSLVEVFGGQGESVITAQIFPK